MCNSMVVWIVLSLLPVFQLFSVAWAQEDQPSTLQGAAFVVAEENRALVSPAWIKKGLAYSKEVGQADLVISLDQHLYPAITPIITKFGQSAGLKIAIREGTCGVSAGMLARKQVDIAGFCCPPAPSDRLPSVVFHTVGLVANVLITHPTNPINNLSIQEARALFSGEITRWSDLSDPAAKSYQHPFHPITRLHCKLRPGHWRYLLDTEDMYSAKVHNVSSIPDMLDQVAADPYAIGWVAHWLLADEKHRDRVKVVSINGISPNEPEALATGRYLFYKVLNITTWHGIAPNDHATMLLNDLFDHLNEIPAPLHIVSTKRLRSSGWQFLQNELVGEPRSLSVLSLRH